MVRRISRIHNVSKHTNPLTHANFNFLHPHPTPPHTYTPLWITNISEDSCVLIYIITHEVHVIPQSADPTKMVKHDIFGVFSQCFARTRVRSWEGVESSVCRCVVISWSSERQDYKRTPDTHPHTTTPHPHTPSHKYKNRSWKQTCDWTVCGRRKLIVVAFLVWIQLYVVVQCKWQVQIFWYLFQNNCPNSGSKFQPKCAVFQNSLIQSVRSEKIAWVVFNNFSVRCKW